jgi:flagellin
MGMQINTNIGALNAYRNLSATQSNLDKSLEKLSSGLRINRAADDAAGLAISEGLRSQVGGLKVAARNAQDGISVVQTAEGGLGEVHSILQRLRDLAVQGANDSNNTEARANITTEANQLVEELDRISASTNFNGTKLLDGSAGTLNFQVGADGDSASSISVDLSGADVSAISTNLQSGLYTRTGTVAAATVAGNWTFTQGGVVVTVAMGTAGTYANNGQVASALNSNAGFANNYVASVNSAGDLDVRSLVSNTAVTVAGTGYTAGAGAAAALNFSSHAGAQASIALIDTQISSVSTARANLGAVQNRFESAINTINVATENLTASESRIRDTDMASEMVNFTRSQILSQAGVAMLAQAKSAPQAVLQLLQG